MVWNRKKEIVYLVGTFSQGQGGGSKSGHNQKKNFIFEFCYQKAFQGSNKKKSVVWPFK